MVIGKMVMESIRVGVAPKWNQRLHVEVVQTYPTAADWSVWRTFLRKIFPLRTPLGRWLPGVRMQCGLAEFEDFVYTKHRLGWMRHARISGSRSTRSKRYSITGTLIDDLPDGVTLTTLEEKPNRLICWGGENQVPISAHQSPAGFSSFCRQRFGVDMNTFAENLQGSNMVVCSDGSYKADHGTASWIAVHGEQEIGGDLVVPDGVHCAYRSELAGILGGLLFVDSIPFASLLREVSIFCDGLSALQMVFGVLPIPGSASHSDLLRQMRDIRSSLLKKGVILTPIHVDGHADERGEYGPFTMEKTWNIRMDSRASSKQLCSSMAGFSN